MSEPSTENDPRRKVIRYVMRLIDYGKGYPDSEFDGMTMGQIADQIIECVVSPESDQPS